MSEVVTGDAVVVEVRVAQMPSRAVAVVIDMLVQGVLMIGFAVLLLNFAGISDSALFAAANIVMVVLVIVGYPVIFETATRGRSLGKLALGLRVVGDDGSPERFRQALMRGLAGVMEFWMFSGAPALISSLVSQRGKRLGDVFAGTIVISERAPRDTTQAIVMPPQLAAWAARLELSQLPDDVASAARQYLARWYDLAPAVQHEMGVRIANQVASYVSPAAPGGAPPHAYLSAVLAERRRREEVRLARHTRLPAPWSQPPGPQPVQPAGPPHTQQPIPAPQAPWAQPPGAPHPQPVGAQPAPVPPGRWAQQEPAAPWSQPWQVPQSASPVPQPSVPQPSPPGTVSPNPWALPGQSAPAQQAAQPQPATGWHPGPTLPSPQGPQAPGQPETGWQPGHVSPQHPMPHPAQPGPVQAGPGVDRRPTALPDYRRPEEPPGVTPGGFAPPA
ncbi:RDD family protein [Nonomuraea sp. NPDC059007]|uniref:RDD family protein n=1 Tax=Nonomuraea sp. NPDC059007 TaxID=3346692 RepID=UPI0036B10711